MTVADADIRVQVIQTLNEQANHHDVDAIVRELIKHYDILGTAPTVAFEDVEDYWDIAERHRTVPTDAVVSTHWHTEIAVPGFDTELFTGWTIFDALEYASDELNNLADWLHDGITVAGKNGLYRLAYERYELSFTYWQLAEDANAAATKYQLHWPGQVNAELLTAAQSAVQAINAGTPDGFVIRECTLDGCAPTTGEGS